MEYTLNASPTRGAKRRIVPPRPAASGERRLLIYGPNDLDSLVATVWLLNPVALVSLLRPPSDRITTWPVLKAFLMRFKARLRYLQKSRGFPKMVVVTEFDPIKQGSPDVAANFHVALAAELSPDQIEILRYWWLRDAGLLNNQGRSFQYDADGGGIDLLRYVSKDKKGGRHVKFRPPWVPVNAAIRLWFCVGLSHGSAAKGRQIRRELREARRTPFYHAERNTSSTTVSVTGKNQSASKTVPFLPIQVAFQAPLKHCQVCWTRWGRSLWAGECICSGRVELSRRCPTLSNS